MLLRASFFIGRILVVRHPEHMMRLEHDVTKLFDSRPRVGLTKVTYLHRMDSPRVIILLSCCHFVVAWRCDGRIFFLKDRYNWLPARRRTMIPLVYCHGYINAVAKDLVVATTLKEEARLARYWVWRASVTSV